ncbi:MAG: META domain-containing protein [Paracoccaceae bacterium]
MKLRWIMAFVAALAAGPVAARTIEGSVTYLARIALPDDALVIIEARAAGDHLLAEERFHPDGRQVPLPFTLDIPDDMDATLRAAIVIGDAPRWVSGDIAVDAGSDPLHLPEIVLSAYQPMGFASTMRCGERQLRVGFFGADAVLEVDGERLVLQPVPAASGAKFQAPDDPGTFFHSRGALAQVSLGGDMLPECEMIAPAPEAAFTARGNEPFWSLTVDGGQMLLNRMDGGEITAPLPDARLDGDDLVYATEGLSLRLTQSLCHDTMSGMPYPQQAQVQVGGVVLHGCAGDPAALLTGAEWQVIAIGDQMPGDAGATITFARDGQISGRGGCNAYGANYTLTGEGISFGLGMATQMACDAPRMRHEGAFFAALPEINRFDIAADGTLLLIADSLGDAGTIRARRAD